MILAAEEYWPQKVTDVAQKTRKSRLQALPGQFVGPFDVLFYPRASVHSCVANLSRRAPVGQHSKVRRTYRLLQFFQRQTERGGHRPYDRASFSTPRAATPATNHSSDYAASY